MNNSNQLHQDFLNDFVKLLKKYDATFEVCDRGCNEYYSNNVPCVQFSSQYNQDEEQVRDFSEFELPDYINPP